MVTMKALGYDYLRQGDYVSVVFKYLDLYDRPPAHKLMDFLRSKLEGSFEALMKTRQELESLLPVEGNSELRSFLLMGSSDLHTELKRHKELCSKVNGHVNATQMHQKWRQGVTQTGSSYEFLKNIFSG